MARVRVFFPDPGTRIFRWTRLQLPQTAAIYCAGAGGGGGQVSGDVETPRTPGGGGGAVSAVLTFNPVLDALYLMTVGRAGAAGVAPNVAGAGGDTAFVDLADLLTNICKAKGGNAGGSPIGSGDGVGGDLNSGTGGVRRSGGNAVAAGGPALAGIGGGGGAIVAANGNNSGANQNLGGTSGTPTGAGRGGDGGSFTVRDGQPGRQGGSAVDNFSGGGGGGGAYTPQAPFNLPASGAIGGHGCALVIFESMINGAVDGITTFRQSVVDGILSGGL